LFINADTTQVFVKLVNDSVSEEMLHEAFSKIGTVKQITLNRAKNCAFLEFQTPEACQKALAQHKVQLGGNQYVLAEERRSFNGPNRFHNNNRPQNQHNNNQNMDRRQTSNHRRGGATRGVNANSGKGRGTPTQK
jgi:RNA recognition motif-containing protein